MKRVNIVLTNKTWNIWLSDSSSNDHVLACVSCVVLVLHFKELVVSFQNIGNCCIHLNVEIQFVHIIVEIFYQDISRREELL